MKVLIASLATETNTFSPMPTGRQAFEGNHSTRHATAAAPEFSSAALHVWRRQAEARGWSVVESRAAAAQPAGPTVRAVYEGYRDEILADVAATRPDIVLLALHGAMVAEGYDDCEGDLTARVRALLGDAAFIGLHIDPHSHLTQAMLDAATVIVAYKEYPHTDIDARAEDVFALAVATVTGQIRPVMADYDCRMMSLYRTPIEPMRSFVDAMTAREGQDAILSLSLIHGFPWGDVARAGTRMLAIADGDGGRAAAEAARWGQRLWGLRAAFRNHWPDSATALDLAQQAASYPVVLVDTADNAGGGAPADSTFVLGEVLARGLQDVALGIYWDPMVVAMCQEAGVGATLRVRLGGKVGPMSGDPVDLEVTVTAIRPAMTQRLGGAHEPMGTGVALRTRGLDLVVSDVRTQVYEPSAFTDLGIDLSAKNGIVVKSTQHFYAGFAPLAGEIIYMATPGALTLDFPNLPYVQRAKTFWPAVEDPFA